jgi:hypothetical protein
MGEVLGGTILHPRIRYLRQGAAGLSSEPGRRTPVSRQTGLLRQGEV